MYELRISKIDVDHETVCAITLDLYKDGIFESSEFKTICEDYKKADRDYVIGECVRRARNAINELYTAQEQHNDVCSKLLIILGKNIFKDVQPNVTIKPEKEEPVEDVEEKEIEVGQLVALRGSSSKAPNMTTIDYDTDNHLFLCGWFENDTVWRVATIAEDALVHATP